MLAALESQKLAVWKTTQAILWTIFPFMRWLLGTSVNRGNLPAIAIHKPSASRLDLPSRPMGSREDWPSPRSRLGLLKEGFAERKVPFGQREVEQPKKPSFLTYRGFGARYGAWHAFDEVSIAPPIEEAVESVAPVVLPTDGVDRVYGRRVPGRIAVAESTIVAVNRKTQLLLRKLAIGQPDLGQLGDYEGGEFSRRGKGTCCGGSGVALGVQS